MASNNSSNSDGGGCLIWVLSIVWILGNIALFTGSFEDLPLLAILAVIGDMFFIRAIIKAMANKSSQNISLQTSRSNQTSTPQEKTRLSTPSAIRTTSGIDDDNGKLNQLQSKYRVPNVSSVVASVDPLQKDMESYLCVEVLQSINRVIRLRRDYAKKMKSLKEEIDELLVCPGCSTVREQLKYIENNEAILQQKKEAYKSASNDMKQVRVILLPKEKTAFNKLLSALSDVISSEKSTSKSGVALSSFIKPIPSVPGNLFVSEQTPIELNFGAYRFFLLPDVVLAYDKANTFVTAFEPIALIITFKDQKKNVYKCKNGSSSWTYSDTVIATDSILVSEGYTKTSWLHERKSGGPDLRYSYNPSYESRSDTYAYSDFSIQIGQYKAEYSISKGNLSNKLKPMVKDYCSVMHELSAIPSLLRLVESVAKKGEAARLLTEQYENVSKKIICKVS